MQGNGISFKMQGIRFDKYATLQWTLEGINVN